MEYSYSNLTMYIITDVYSSLAGEILRSFIKTDAIQKGIKKRQHQLLL